MYPISPVHIITRIYMQMYLATKGIDVVLQETALMQERHQVGLHTVELFLFDDRVTENYRSYYYR